MQARSRADAAICLVCAVIIVIVWAVTAERIEFERGSDISQAFRQNSNLALAFEEHTIGSLRRVDEALQLLEREYVEHGERLNLGQMVADGGVDFSDVSFFGVVNAEGILVAGTGKFEPVSVADRAYFVRHQADSRSGLLVGAPLVGRVTGRQEIPLSRRIVRPDGSMGGVAIAGVEPDYFNRFYGKIDVGAHGLVQLVGLDGIVRARRTGSVSSAGQDLRASTLLQHVVAGDSGDFLSVGGLDEIPRYMSFRVLKESALVVAVGTSQEDVLAASQVRKGWYLLGSSLATVFVLVYGAGLLLALRRQKHAIESAIAGEALYRVTFEQAPLGIVHHALDGRFLRANLRYCEMTGYAEKELLTRRFQDLLLPEDAPDAAQMAQRLKSGSLQTECRKVRKDGTVFWVSVDVAVVRDSSGTPDFLVAMVQDLTERRKAQEQLLHLTQYDVLTGLPNRVLLFDRLEQTLGHARRNERTAGVLFVDLDRFKAVNDALGHETGDLLLRETAARLARSVRSVDTVARVGGDEFVVLLGEIADAQNAARVSSRIIAAMARPFEANGGEVFITASIGVAIFPGDGLDSAALIRNADVAMSRAKKIGRNNFQFYTSSLNERAMDNLLLESGLRHALERGEFRLHFQPKAGIAGHRVSGFEALLRWQRAGSGLVSPADFIPLLEESGMILAVGEWVIRSACAQLRDWKLAGWAPVPVAVNVSAVQFRLGDIFEIVDCALRDHGIDAALLEIEITESDAMLNPDHVLKILQRLKARGVRIAIDDFGTGYSSLSYLKRFPISLLKIDRSFVTGLPHDANDASIARAIVAMAHSLGLEIIAEGVETEAQRAFLEETGCDQMQGYLFSRPLPPAECTAFLRRSDAPSGAVPTQALPA